MQIENEISLDNFHKINQYAAVARGEKIRSRQDDRWLTSTAASAYCCVYDPRLGHLITFWRELRPDLIILYGEAHPKTQLTFPIRATEDVSGVLIGANISLQNSQIEDETIECFAGKPKILPLSLSSGDESTLTIIAERTSFYFGIFGAKQALKIEFSIVNTLSDFLQKKNPCNRSATRRSTFVDNTMIPLILQMIRNPYRGEILDTFILGKVLEILSLSCYSSQNMASTSRLELKKSPVSFICSELSRAPADIVVLSDFSEYLGISTRALSRSFKDRTGMTFSAYQRMRRMGLALQRLTTTTVPATHISEEVGYQSVTAFYRAFKGQYGMTPDEYRRSPFQ